MKKNKIYKLLMILGIITCLTIIGTCIYFIFNSIKTDNSNSKKENNSKIENKVDKDNNVDESKKEDTKLNETELEVTDEDKVLAQELFDKFKVLKNDGTGGIDVVLYEKDITLSTDLGNDAILKLAMYQYTTKEKPFSNFDKSYRGEESMTISSNKLKKYVTDIFGKNFIYKNADIPGYCFSGVYGLYDSNNDVYVFSRLENGCGGSGVPGIPNKIIEVKKYNDRMEIIEKIGYIESRQLDKCLAPVLYNHPIEKVLIELASCDNREEDIFNNNLDKLPSYKYTFKKDGTNYYFEKIERVN